MDDRLSLRDRVRYEWQYRLEAGFDVPALDDPSLDADPGDLHTRLDALRAATRRADWPYHEPSSPGEIAAELGPDPGRSAPPDPAGLRSRIDGAWTGRVAGNMLGKPVEVGWRRDRLADYLRSSASLDPDGRLRDWVVADAATAAGVLEASWPTTTRGNVHGSVRDDDVDYTVLALMLLEQHGVALTPGHVSDAWLRHLPYLQVFTAEREAYASLVRGTLPPRTAVEDNPFGEWIGALIRADAYGLVLPGRPRDAAMLALQDAAVSHVGNGLYGAMWAASLVSHALVADSARAVVEASLSEVPARSRLHEVLTSTIGLYESGLPWAEALDTLDTWHGLDALHHVHVLNNAAVIAAALLWGEGDPAETIGLAVQGALDTDSNAATAGAVVGALRGIDALPGRWRTELGDTVRTALAGVGEVSLEELAERTYRLALALADA